MLKWRKVVVALSIRNESARGGKFLRLFQIGHISLTTADTYCRDSYCLAQVFRNLPAPPKQYSIFDVFCDFQSFFQLQNLGSHLAMCPDDRFLPQGKQILPEICQVRPRPKQAKLW